MSQNLLLNEVLRKMSDPATLAALQAATAPLIAGLQQKQAEVKETIKGNQDPLSALFDLLGGSIKVEVQQAEEEQSQAEIKQDEVALAVATLFNKNGQLFFHAEKGTPYLFLNITNVKSTDQVKFPTTVTYFDFNNETVWSRPVVEFVKKFVEA